MFFVMSEVRITVEYAVYLLLYPLCVEIHGSVSVSPHNETRQHEGGVVERECKCHGCVLSLLVLVGLQYVTEPWL